MRALLWPLIGTVSRQLTHQADQQLCKGWAEIKPGPAAAQHPHAEHVTWAQVTVTVSSVLLSQCSKFHVPPLSLRFLNPLPHL